MSTLLEPNTPSASPDLPNPTPSATEPQRRGSWFSAFWRWHFYASFLVIPVLAMLAVTGLIYLFRFQIEPALHPNLMRVDAPAGAPLQSYDSQLVAVRAALEADGLVDAT